VILNKLDITFVSRSWGSRCRNSSSTMLGKSAAEFTDVGDSGHFASAHDRDRPMSLHLLEDRRHQLDVFSGSIVELESVSISLTLHQSAVAVPHSRSRNIFHSRRHYGGGTCWCLHDIATVHLFNETCLSLLSDLPCHCIRYQLPLAYNALSSDQTS